MFFGKNASRTSPGGERARLMQWYGLLRARQVHDSRDNRGNHDPEQLKPVEKRDTCEIWFAHIVEWRPAQRDNGEEQEQK